MAKAFPNTGVTTGLAADRTAMTGMTAGTYFYETDTNKIWVYNGTSWLNTQDLTNTVNGYLPTTYKAGPKVASIELSRGQNVGTQGTSTGWVFWSNLGTMTVAAQENDMLFLTNWWWWDGFSGWYNVAPVTLNASNVHINCLTTRTADIVRDPRLSTVQYDHVQSHMSYKVKANDVVSGTVKVGFIHQLTSGSQINYLGASAATVATHSLLVNYGQ